MVRWMGWGWRYAKGRHTGYGRGDNLRVQMQLGLGQLAGYLMSNSSKKTPDESRTIRKDVQKSNENGSCQIQWKLIVEIVATFCFRSGTLEVVLGDQACWMGVKGGMMRKE